MYDSWEYNKQTEMFLDWGCTPLTQHLASKLDQFLPLMGEIDNPKENPALEKFRKAQNVVYDIFNNGFGNRYREWRNLGVRKRDLPLPTYYNNYYWPGNWDRVNEYVEEAFTPIVMAAAKEQGLV